MPEPPAPPFTGVAVALVTLFDAHERLDAAATGRHAAALVDRGVDAVLVAGTTGEARHLTPDERVDLLDAVKAAIPGTVPVIAGTGADSMRQAVDLTASAVAHGADAVLALSPRDAREVRPYYDEVADAAGAVPLLAYHYPAVSPPGIPLEVLADLRVAGLKDSTGDAERLLREVEEWDRPVYPGAAVLTYLAGALGCPGVILALANLEPELCAAAFAGDVGAQRALLPAHLASRPSPHGLKAELERRSGTSPVCRVPA